MQTVETQAIIDTYTMKSQVLSHVLLVLDETSNVDYLIRCGGALPRYVHEKGYFIPLRLFVEIFPRKLSDHYSGCGELNYGKHPELVEKYRDQFNIIVNQVYLDRGNLTIKFDDSRIDQTLEGYIPVIVSGKSLTGSKFQDTKCVLIMGNCS